MSRIKNLAAVFGVLSVWGTQSAALDPLIRTFAGCAGRFSAEMEHAWLMSDARAEEHEAYRASFVSLLDAAVGAGEGRSVLRSRVETKMAHAALLTLAEFSMDQDRSRTAQKTAVAHLSACKNLLLGG